MVADDRRHVGPSNVKPSRLVGFAVAALVMVTALSGAVAFLLVAPPPAPVTIAPVAPRVTPPPVVVPKPVATPAPDPIVEAPEPTSTPAKPITPPVPPKPVTNEDWLRRVFKSKHQKLQACVEQDLRVNPNAPTLYMVTLTFEPDGLPVNSFTQLTPKGSRAVWDCLRMAIFSAINEEGEHNRALPHPGNFTLSLPLDFSGAKPASKKAVGFGDD